MKNYIYLFILGLLSTIVTSNGVSLFTTNQYLQEGKNLLNNFNFYARDICDETLPWLNQTIYEIPFGSYNLGEPSVSFDYLIQANRDCRIVKANLQDGTILFDFELSAFGGRNCSGILDPFDGVLNREDWTRSTPALIRPIFGIIPDRAVVCQTGIGGNSTCFIFDPRYSGPGAPPLYGSVQLDTDGASIVTASPQCLFYNGRRICVIATSSRSEFWTFPVGITPTFDGGIYVIDIDTFEIIWVTKLCPEDDPDYAGCAVVASPTVVPILGKVFVASQNNVLLPQEILDCIAAGLTNCSEIDNPSNRPDSITALNLDDGSVEWSQERSGDKSPDVSVVFCFPGQDCESYEGDDGGPLTATQIAFVWDPENLKYILCAIQAFKRGEVEIFDAKTGRSIKKFKTGPGSLSGGGHSFSSTYSTIKNYGIFTNFNADSRPWTLVDGTNTTGPFITVIDYNNLEIVMQKETMGGCFQGGVMLNDKYVVCHNRNDPSSPTVQFYDLFNNLENVHNIDVGCTSGNMITIVDNKVIIPCGYAFSPFNTKNSLVVVGMSGRPENVKCTGFPVYS